MNLRPLGPEEGSSRFAPGHIGSPRSGNGSEYFRSGSEQTATDSTGSHPISQVLSHPCPKILGAREGAFEREKLLTVAQVAAKFGVCKATVYRLVENGELPHIRVGTSIRILAGVLEATSGKD